MEKPNSLGELKNFVPKSSELTATIRRIAEDSGQVGFGNHSIDRMEERGITRLDVLRVLRGGDIRGNIEPGRSHGEWKCKIVMNIKGSRDVGVATVVVDGRRIFVKTAEWEDQ